MTAEPRATEESLEAANAKRHAAEHEVYSARHRHEQTQSELARLGLDLTMCQNDLSHVRQEAEAARARAEGYDWASAVDYFARRC